MLSRRGKGEASFLLCKSPERGEADVMKRGRRMKQQRKTKERRKHREMGRSGNWAGGKNM